MSYNPNTGIFTWMVSRRGSKGIVAGTIAGGKIDGGWGIGIDGVRYRAHRLAWLYMYGHWPVNSIDHIDGNPLNNSISNLRDIPHAANMQNIRRSHRDSYSQLIGAYRARNGKWRSHICIDGKIKNLGQFKTAELAHQAYLKAKKIYHPFQTIAL
jgi:hypothetical protein